MNLTTALNLVIGIMMVLIIGFFAMEFILAAITLATGFDKGKDTYASATKQMTGALKGILLALATFFLLNTLLVAFGVRGLDSSQVTTVLGDQWNTLITCLRDFNVCR